MLMKHLQLHNLNQHIAHLNFFYGMEIILSLVLSSVWQILTTKSVSVVTIIINFKH